MNNVFVHHSPGLHTTRLVRRLVLLGFVIGLVTLLSFVWYLYQMHQAKSQLQAYQDHYTQIFTSFNLTLSEAQREIRDLMSLPIEQLPVQSPSWSKHLIELSLELVKTQKEDREGKQESLEKTIASLLDLRHCLVNTHMQLRTLHFSSQEQFAKILATTSQMREMIGIHQGEHRLLHARLIRQYLDHSDEQTPENSLYIIDHIRDVLVLQGMDVEFDELDKYLDQLNRSDDTAHIADLKDNRIAALINRMHHDNPCEKHDRWREDYMQSLILIERNLFGKSVPSNTELQTIDYADGSFFNACLQSATLKHELKDIFKRIEENINQLLRLQTDIALQTRVSANEVWADFQLAGQKNFIQTAVILSSCWSLFFFMGVLIHNQVRRQVYEQQKTQEQLHLLAEQREKAQQETQQIYQKLIQAHKLESVGQLAAGIATEINSPSQYVSDNSKFLKKAFTALKQINQLNENLIQEARHSTQMMPYVQAIETAVVELDAEFLWDEVPNAIDQTIEGIGRVSDIVESMRQFAQPACLDRIAYDVNTAVKNALMVSRSTWKYVAKVDTNLCENLPHIPAFPSDANQALLNVIVNAAHAISDQQKIDTLHEGLITITTLMVEKFVMIRIMDNGVGMVREIQRRIFDPFFTTRAVGQGAGQGLALAYSSIVEKHKGSIDVISEVGLGTTFIIKLPLGEDAATQLGTAASRTATDG